MSLEFVLICKLCEPHIYICGEICGQNVKTDGSQGRYSRHPEIKHIIQRSLNTINVPSRLEPTGLYRDDGNCSTKILYKCNASRQITPCPS